MEARHSGGTAMARRQGKRFVMAFAWAMAATTGHDWATAADLKLAPRQASTQFDWTGFYVGGHVGYTRGHAEVTVADPDPIQFSKSFGSLAGGLQGGYNYVLPSRFLLGVEADASFLNYLSADDLAWSRTTPDTNI